METAAAFNALIMSRSFYLCNFIFFFQWVEIKSNQKWPTAVLVTLLE